MERDLDPVIVFSFSKKDCEQYGLQMSKYDFNNDEEKELVEKVFLSALDSLSEDDQTLPQIGSLLPLLKRGIGIHHGYVAAYILFHYHVSSVMMSIYLSFLSMLCI